ncbi:MAG: ECF-type sigma factor [Phycisphaerales bacterium]
MDERVTTLLAEARRGAPGAAEALLAEVYDQLRRVAQVRMNQERRGHTLQATALVHEAYLRLLGSGPGSGAAPSTDRAGMSSAAGGAGLAGRAQFFAAAGEAMRRILIEHARARNREKRGGGRGRVSLESIGDVADLARIESSGESDGVLAFDEAFRRLEEHDAEVAAVVRLRFFSGLTVAETSEALGISERTVNNRWSYARAWIARAVEAGGTTESAGGPAGTDAADSTA